MGHSFFCLEQQILSLINWNSVQICPISPCLTKFLLKHEQKQIAKLCKFHGSKSKRLQLSSQLPQPTCSIYMSVGEPDYSCRANIVGLLCRTNAVKKLDKYCLEWLVGQILWKTWNGSSDKGELRRHVIGHTSTRLLALHQDPAQHLSSRRSTCLVLTTSKYFFYQYFHWTSRSLPRHSPSTLLLLIVGLLLVPSMLTTIFTRLGLLISYWTQIWGFY